MKIHCNDVISPSYAQHISYQFGRDWGTALLIGYFRTKTQLVIQILIPQSKQSPFIPSHSEQKKAEERKEEMKWRV